MFPFFGFEKLNFFRLVLTCAMPACGGGWRVVVGTGFQLNILHKYQLTRLTATHYTDRRSELVETVTFG
jgi:hypothetical protein